MRRVFRTNKSDGDMKPQPEKTRRSRGRYGFASGGAAVLAAALMTLSTPIGGSVGSRVPSAIAATAAKSAPASSGAIVVDWNKELVQIVGTAGVQPATIHPTRSFAILHAAIYDAVLAITHGDTPYLFSLDASPGARPDAAAAQAGHDVLAMLYPSMKASIDQQLAVELAVIPDGIAKQQGIGVGRLSAAFMLAARADDGSNAALPAASPTATPQPGDYRPTPPFVAPGVFTQWSQVTPFVLRQSDQFRSAPPPGLSTAAYAQAMNEVKSLGAANSTTRTAEQTTIARFWSAPIWITWNQIAENAALAHHTNLLHTARLFTLLNLSFADATIAMYDAKYTYHLWRPVTAIREAASAGNPAVVADPTWAPLLNASDPSYPGAHSVISAAGAQVLTTVFGKRDPVDVTSTVLPGAVRSFPSYNAAATEAGLSRIYGGVHTRLDHTSGLRLGRQVAHFVLGKAGSHTFGPSQGQ